MGWYVITQYILMLTLSISSKVSQDINHGTRGKNGGKSSRIYLLLSPKTKQKWKSAHSLKKKT